MALSRPAIDFWSLRMLTVEQRMRVRASERSAAHALLVLARPLPAERLLVLAHVTDIWRRWALCKHVDSILALHSLGAYDVTQTNISISNCLKNFTTAAWRWRFERLVRAKLPQVDITTLDGYKYEQRRRARAKRERRHAELQHELAREFDEMFARYCALDTPAGEEVRAAHAGALRRTLDTDDVAAHAQVRASTAWCIVDDTSDAIAAAVAASLAASASAKTSGVIRDEAHDLDMTLPCCEVCSGAAADGIEYFECMHRPERPNDADLHSALVISFELSQNESSDDDSSDSSDDDYMDFADEPVVEKYAAAPLPNACPVSGRVPSSAIARTIASVHSAALARGAAFVPKLGPSHNAFDAYGRGEMLEIY